MAARATINLGKRIGGSAIEEPLIAAPPPPAGAVVVAAMIPEAPAQAGQRARAFALGSRQHHALFGTRRQVCRRRRRRIAANLRPCLYGAEEGQKDECRDPSHAAIMAMRGKDRLILINARPDGAYKMFSWHLDGS